MRWSRALKELTQSKSRESKALEWSSSPAPEGAGEEQPPYSKRDGPATGEDCDLEFLPEGPEWREQSWLEAVRSLPEWLPPMPGCQARGGGLTPASTPASRRRRQRGSEQTSRTGRASRGRRPTFATLLTWPGPPPARRAPAVLLKAWGLPSTLMSTCWTGCTGSTSGRTHSRSRHTRRQTRRGGCWRLQSSRTRQHPGTGDASRRKHRAYDRIPLCTGPQQAAEQPGEVLQGRCRPGGGAARNRRGRLHPQPRVAAIPGGHNSLHAISVTLPWPPASIQRPVNSQRREATDPVTGSGTRVTANDHAGTCDGQKSKSALVETANSHAESVSEPDGPSSGPKTETACGQRVSVKSPGEIAHVHETANGLWRESTTRKTGHTTHQTANGHDNALHENSYYEREREDHEEWEREWPLAEPPTSRERNRGSRSTEAERASTDDSCEQEGPATPTPVREEAAESHSPTEAKTLASRRHATYPEGEVQYMKILSCSNKQRKIEVSGEEKKKKKKKSYQEQYQCV